MAKESKLTKAAVKIGGALGRTEGKAIATGKKIKKKAKDVGKELKESKKHLVRAYEKAKA